MVVPTGAGIGVAPGPPGVLAGVAVEPGDGLASGEAPGEAPGGLVGFTFAGGGPYVVESSYPLSA